MKTRRVYFEAKEHVAIRIEEVEPLPDEILVKGYMSSICGTDKNHFLGFLPRTTRVDAFNLGGYSDPSPYPRFVGHEGAGTIIAVGSAVTGYKEGDQVMSFTGKNATMADYWAAKIQPRGTSVQKVLEGMTMEEASLGEPAACAIYAGMQSGVELGDTVLIVGAGFAGQVMAQVVRQMGAGKVIVSDIVNAKLELAKKLSADITVDASNEDTVDVVLRETNGKGADVVIEAAGNEDSIQVCTDAVKHGGIIGFYSWVLHPVNLIIDRWHNDGFDIRTLAVMHRIKHDKEWYQVKALSNIVNGKINIKPLITDIYKLDDVVAAFDCACNNPESCKVMLRP